MTVRKRRGGSRVASRTAQLEEKLEDLVSLLRNQGTVLKPPAAADATSGTTTHEPSPPALWLNTPAPSHGSQSDTAAAGSRDARSDSNPRPRFPLNPQTTVDVSNSAFIPGLFNHPAARPVPIESMIQQPWIPATPRQAEEHLRLFRDQYLQCCPCIYIPPDTTSEQLRKEKPFSWFTIMMMACQTSSLQFAMGGVWQDIVAQKIIVEHEKDLDLLQGMVIFLIWSVLPPAPEEPRLCPTSLLLPFPPNANPTVRSHYHKKDKPYLGVFSQVALSHVYDLALNKLPADPLTFFTCKKGTAFDHSVHPRPTTMEDRRTVLACWCITSQFVISARYPLLHSPVLSSNRPPPFQPRLCAQEDGWSTMDTTPERLSGLLGRAPRVAGRPDPGVAGPDPASYRAGVLGRAVGTPACLLPAIGSVLARRGAQEAVTAGAGNERYVWHPPNPNQRSELPYQKALI